MCPGAFYAGRSVQRVREKMDASEPIMSEPKRRSPAMKSPPLGSITKFASRTSLTEDKIVKYALQSAARELAPHSRVRSCMMARLPERETVEIWHSPKRNTAYYRNLMRCGSIWLCPVCASSITERRLSELKRLTSARQTVSIVSENLVERSIDVPVWRLAMGTFTIAHTRNISLKDTLKKLDTAYKSFWSGRWGMSFKSTKRIEGTIRSLEITYGKNGWHPHYHTLLFARSQWTPNKLMDTELDMMFRWEDCALRAGARARQDVGLDLRAADENILDYIGKMGQQVIGESVRWSVLSEVTKFPVKRGMKDNRTLWDLLAEYMGGDVRSGELWIEAQSVLKGKQHMVASVGLYKLLGATLDLDRDDLTGEEQIDPSDALLASLNADEWRTVIARGARGSILEVASRGDRQLLIDYLESLL